MLKLRDKNKWLDHLLLAVFIFFIYFFGQTATFSQVGIYSGDYSTLAQDELDDYSTENPSTPQNLDVFKFSIEEILDANNAVVEGPNNEPLLYGKTDYGSEFTLYNDLDTSFKIEIPSFVIDVLAEDTDGEYYPVIINGDDGAIDFKDQYDTLNGETITPEKGFVKLIEETEGQYENLEDGDIVEFFVTPTAIYSGNHNQDTLFYIDRPVPSSETEGETVTNDDSTSSTTDTQQNDPDQETVVSSPVNETEPTIVEINYMTTVYVAAPASNFNPTTIVIPVQSDGDYVQGILPGPAESFPSDMEVVAIPSDEEERIVNEVADDKKYVRKNERPVIDEALKAAKSLNESAIFVQKSRGMLVENSKKMLAKGFPNLSTEFINFLFNIRDRKTRFEIMSNPSKYLNDELVNLDQLLSKDTFDTSNLTSRELIKFNYLLDVKFADELARSGLPQSKTKIIPINSKVDIANIFKKNSLQKDLLPLIAIIAPKLNEQEKNKLTEDQTSFKENSSSELLEKKSHEETFNKVKFFSSLIDKLSNQSFIDSQSQVEANNQDLPLVEINVKADQNIKDALNDKMTAIKAVNRPYQTRSFKATLGNFDFDIPDERTPVDIGETLPVRPESIEIPKSQLQFIAEATETADNLINQTLDKMLQELGFQAPQIENGSLFSYESDVTNQDIVINLLQNVNERTKVVEDIRAIFQTMGLGS